MEEKKLVPKLRFPGFTEPWEQRKLGNLYKRVNERNDGSLGRDKWISVAKMYFQDPDKVQSNNLDTRTYVMKTGDIAFEGHPNNEFKFGRFVLNDIGTGIISELFPIYRPITEYDLDFWKYAIQLERVMAPIFAKSITSSGNSSNKLDHNHFLNQELLVPNIEEQKKIGTLLSILSKNIALHQRKLEHLKLKKKSLLQKLFPKEGEVYPELRFPGFTDPWEQRKGDEVFISVSDKGYPQLPVLSASQELGMVYRDENGIDIHHNKSNEDTYKRVLPGQFVIHLRSFQGGFAYSNVEGITSPAYTVITFKNPELHYGLFWKQVFKSLTFIKHLETITYGIRDGRSISFSDFRSLKLCYPTYGEQKFIGDGLEKTDNLITLHQRKLEHLQLLKKALLQQLFV